MKTRFRRPRGRPPYPGILTPAEQRVLEALRVESTNAAIAARLGIGVETVRYHLENIRGKLGIEERAALAAWTPPAPQAPAPRRTWLAAPLLILRSGTVLSRVAVAAAVALLVAGLAMSSTRRQWAPDRLPAAQGTPATGPTTWLYQQDVGFLNIAGRTALPDGSVLVVGDVQERGASGKRVPGERDIAIFKVDPHGARQYSTIHQSAGSDRVRSFAVRPDGGVYVVGATNGRLSKARRLGRSDGFIAAFSSSGGIEWVRTFGTANIDAATAVSVLEDGDVAVFWASTSSGGALSVFDPSGDLASTVPLPEGVSVTGALPEDGGLIAARGTLLAPERWGWGSRAIAAGFTRDGRVLWSDALADSTLNVISWMDRQILFGGTRDPRGPFNEPAGSPSAFVVAYTPAGQRMWFRELSTTGRDTLWPTALAGAANTGLLVRLGLDAEPSTGFPPYTQRPSTPTLPGLEGTYLLTVDSAGTVTPVERLPEQANLLGPGGRLFDVSVLQQPGLGRRSGGPYALVVRRRR